MSHRMTMSRDPSRGDFFPLALLTHTFRSHVRYPLESSLELQRRFAFVASSHFRFYSSDVVAPSLLATLYNSVETQERGCLAQSYSMPMANGA